MLATGALISAASIYEWQRLVRLINARLDNQRTPTSAAAVVIFFVLRLTVFAGVIYGSLKCFQGSVTALLCGLGLAALAIGWEAIRMLRD
jgi:small-conductance mechanosensitive channel